MLFTTLTERVSEVKIKYNFNYGIQKAFDGIPNFHLTDLVLISSSNPDRDLESMQNQTGYGIGCPKMKSLQATTLIIE